MNNNAVGEDLLTLKILLYDPDNVDRNKNGEHAARNVQNHENTVRLLRYNNQISCVSDINAVT